ncbi:hypothetical protein [Actinomadura macrotermitis]|uniref:Uncharacterized protein n=1 Tax=Actinomadura macrotermitis TaxID=2585200 RepID=A0A7K0BYS1_9ACTN|nr:hypothetical protein [Actinomadura macrotermitis]MQY06330.1 hypothetical protein [Actinomadura macrotermitis]
MSELAPRPGIGIGPDGSYTRRGQALAFLCGLWAMIVFLPLLVLGALLYTRAEERFPQDPDGARRLVLWSWLSLTVLPLAPAAVVAGITAALRA